MHFYHHSLITLSPTHYSDAKDQPFQVKNECQNITDLFCNLTAETPSVHDVHYRAQVFANERFLGRTNTFKPLADSKNLHTHSRTSLFPRHIMLKY